MKLSRYGPDDFTLEHMSLEEISVIISAVRLASKIPNSPKCKEFRNMLDNAVKEAIGGTQP